ncbi:MAG: S-layer homology domain-containing protein, partial [Ruminococcus flavefaciens]|nr:S-layer homology domain-containing protein [Ruminococcus flavefaciens]
SHMGGEFNASADDTPSEWAQGEVWEAICSKLAPNDLQSAYRKGITREEFCRLMVALVEQKTEQSVSAYISSKGLAASDPFTDTDSAEVTAAYTLGIVNGRSADSFDPNGAISRQEAAAMLTRTARLFGITSGAGVSFADAGEFASWASESIAFISGVTDPVTGGRVMNGTGNGNFSAWDGYTREQAILTALRLFHCA